MGADQMARRRLGKNRGLEPYVKECRGYYTYLHPVMRARGVKAHSFGRNKDLANQTARVVNAELAGALDPAARILGTLDPAPAHSLAEVIDGFKAHYVKLPDWSEGYRTEQFTRLDKIRKVAGKQPFAALDVKAIKSIIFDNFSGDGRRLARLTLIHVWRYGIGEGYADKLMVNYPEKVNVPKQEARKRERIKDMAEFQAMRAKCPAWLQDAMDLALITLQRRIDIVSVRLSDIKKIDGQEWLHFIPQKTIRAGTAMKLPIGDNLRPVIRRCQTRALKLGCPFLICTPQKGAPNRKVEKEHRCQVVPDYVTRTFKECTGGQFHEIRSLGEREYEALGYTPEQIRNLGGWKDDKMRKLYGETDEITYVEAMAGLKLVDNR